MRAFILRAGMQPVAKISTAGDVAEMYSAEIRQETGRTSDVGETAVIAGHGPTDGPNPHHYIPDTPACLRIVAAKVPLISRHRLA